MSATSCPSTPATNWWDTCAGCGGVSTGGKRRTRRSTRSSPVSGAGRGRWIVADLAIDVTGVEVEPNAAVPTIMFATRLRETSGATIHAIALRAQIRIEPQRRRYSAAEEERLLELFGETPQWGESLRPFLWSHVETMVAGFVEETTVSLPMACSYDFEVAGAKYLHSLETGSDAGGTAPPVSGPGESGPSAGRGQRAGEVPLLFLFSGTVFTKGGPGFAAELIPWNLESRFRLPVRTWRQTMDRYFPNAGWLRLSRDTIDRLQRFRAERALPTWEQAIEVLLKEAGEDGI